MENSQVDDSRCIHYWMLETPKGANSEGTCKKCQEKKMFPNADNSGGFTRRKYGQKRSKRSYSHPVEDQVISGVAIGKSL